MPARSSSRKARRLTWRLTPRTFNRSFGSGKVFVCAAHDRCSSQIQTKAFGVRVACDACSAHHKGTWTNLSIPFDLARTGWLHPYLLLLVLLKEMEHVSPDLHAALITVAARVSHNSGFGSQLIRPSRI